MASQQRSFAALQEEMRKQCQLMCSAEQTHSAVLLELRASKEATASAEAKLTGVATPPAAALVPPEEDNIEGGRSRSRSRERKEREREQERTSTGGKRDMPSTLAGILEASGTAA